MTIEQLLPVFAAVAIIPLMGFLKGRIPFVAQYASWFALLLSAIGAVVALVVTGDQSVAAIFTDPAALFDAISVVAGVTWALYKLVVEPTIQRMNNS